MKFFRVGTLDEPDAMPPDLHIFTASIQALVDIPATTPSFAEYYDREQVWSAESLACRQWVLSLIEAYQASRRNTQV